MVIERLLVHCYSQRLVLSLKLTDSSVRCHIDSDSRNRMLSRGLVRDFPRLSSLCFAQAWGRGARAGHDIMGL